jgi:uncharacterized repeat protein (TIGR01451 family)
VGSRLRSRARVAGCAAALLAAIGSPRAAVAVEREFPLDVDLADRVDPVPPGGNVVYEVELENFTEAIAPDVVLTDFMPPGTSFVSAYRQFDWAAVPAELEPGIVRLLVGAVEPCDLPETARCRDVWLALRVDPSVAPGTVLENRVRIESSDPSHPPNEADIFTTVGTAAIQKALVLVGVPGRDSFSLRVALGRSGLQRGNDPPTPTLDPSAGFSLRIGAAGSPPIVEVAIPASELDCTSSHGNPFRHVRCKLARRGAFAAYGLDTLRLDLPPYVTAQRNNAKLRLAGKRLAIDPSLGPELEVTVESPGGTSFDSATLTGDRRRRYP